MPPTTETRWNRRRQRKRSLSDDPERIAMIGHLRLFLAAASLSSLAVGSSASLAQTRRPWVDPPAAGAQAQPSVSRPGEAPSAPRAPDPEPLASSESTPSSETAEKADAPSGRSDGAEASAVAESRKPAVEEKRDKAAVERQKKRSSRRNAVAAKTQREKVSRERKVSRKEKRRAAERRTRVTRSERIQDGLESGLRLMTLRTIQLPDGRRIQVLVRPDPEVVSELMGR